MKISPQQLIRINGASGCWPGREPEFPRDERGCGALPRLFGLGVTSRFCHYFVSYLAELPPRSLGLEVLA